MSFSQDFKPTYVFQLLYIANGIGQIYLLDSYLGTHYHAYGITILHKVSMIQPVYFFPVLHLNKPKFSKLIWMRRIKLTKYIALKNMLTEGFADNAR